MTRILLTLVFLTINFYIYSQEPLSSFNIKLVYPNHIKPLAITDSNGDANFIYVLSDKIIHVRHNIKTGGHTKKEYRRFSNTFPRLHGLNVGENGEINLFFSNYRGDGFFLMSLDEENEKAYVKQYDLKFDSKERFFKTLNHHNQFQMLTYVKGASVLKRYLFSKSKVKTIVYDLEDESFYNKYGTQAPLSNVLGSKDDCSVIESNIPLSLEIASKKVKIYPSKEELLISLNHRKEGTRIIRLNSTNNTSKTYFFKAKTKSLGVEQIKKSNSFILNDTLYFLSMTKNDLSFSASNINTEEQFKMILFKKNDSILFKNGPIYEQGSVTTSPFSNKSVSERRVIETSKKFLQRLSKSDIAIQVFERDRMIDLTIGGINSNKGGGGYSTTSSITGIQEGKNNQIEIVRSSTTPLYYSFNSYISSSSIFFKSLLNSNDFTHIVNDSPNIASNVFDRISMRSRYLKNAVLKRKLAIETIFKMHDFWVYGYYNKKEKTYTLVRFD